MFNSLDEGAFEEAQKWINSNHKVILATVIKTWGSSPRPSGSRMIVRDDGNFFGSVSGGCVESTVIRECLNLIKINGNNKILDFKVSNQDAWDVGLACGGELTVYLEKTIMNINIINQVLELKKKKLDFSLITNLKNKKSYIFIEGEKLENEIEDFNNLITDAFKKRSNQIINNTQLFIDNYYQPTKIFIIGAVHIAQEIIKISKFLKFEITVIDPRGFFASEFRFPGTKVIKEWPKNFFEKQPIKKNDALVALTHDPKIDDFAIQHALNNNCFYIGALGSKKTHENRIQRLKDNGLKDYELKKIFGPIGLNLGGRSAPEIALSIISQIVSEIYKK